MESHALAILSAISSPSITLAPLSVASISKQRSPSPSNAAPISEPFGIFCEYFSANDLSRRCSLSLISVQVHESVGESSPAPHCSLSSFSRLEISFTGIPLLVKPAANQVVAAPPEESKSNKSIPKISCQLQLDTFIRKKSAMTSSLFARVER